MVLGVAVVLLVCFTGYQALKVKTNLQLVAEDFSTLGRQLTSGDQGGARQTLEQAQGHAREARDGASGPGWWISAHLPGVGRNVQAVRTVADVTDNLASQVLPDVVKATGTLKPENLRPTRGRVDLAPITAASPSVVRADRRLERQTDRVTDIDAATLSPLIARPVRRLQDRLADASALSDRLSRAVRLLPPMLGSQGRRTYLLMFQNNAEIRATGGIPGSFATVTASNGKVSLNKQDDAGTIGPFATSPLKLTEAEENIFGDDLGRYPQDVNFTPDFPRSAELIQAMYERRIGTKLDGVISTDPVALSYLLKGTGSVALDGGGRLTAQDAVETLLSRVYGEITDPAEQNVYFNSVAKSVFDAVASGQGQPRTVLTNLTTSVAERRILLYSDRPGEESLIAPTALAGALPRARTEHPQVGVYFNDAGASKLEYYFDYGVDVRSTRCQGGRQFMTTTVHLRSRVPKGARGLAEYVKNHVQGAPPGRIQATMFVYAPVDGYFDGATFQGRKIDLQTDRQYSRTVASRFITLDPGRSQTLTFQMASGTGQTGDPEVAATPGVRSDGVGQVSGSACAIAGR